MRFHRQLVTIVSATAALLGGTAAHAGSRPFMPQGDAVAPPPGFVDLCQRGGIACGPASADMEQASLATTSAIPTSAIGATSSIGGASSFPQLARAQRAEAQSDAEISAQQFTVLQAYRPDVAADFTVATGWTFPQADDIGPARAAPVETPATVINTAQGPELRSNLMKMVNAINRDVNRDVHKATDFDLYGMMEYWSLPRVIDGKMYGDCEDFALEKRRRLIEAGVPAEALSMAVAVTARGESHAVLVVRFESGDWVLDNLTPWATPWEELNYHWVQRQVAGTGAWMAVG